MMDNEKKDLEYTLESEEETGVVLDAETEEVIEDSIEEVIEETEEVLEDFAEETAEETETFEEEIPEASDDMVCEECEEDEAYAEYEGEEEYSDEEIAAPAKNNKPLFAILGVIALAVVAVIIYCVCYTNSVGFKSAVNTLPPVEVSDMGEIVGNEEMKIKFENPFVSMFEGKAGTTASAMKIGGYSVPVDVFKFFATNNALNYQYGLYQSKKITDLDSFDWNAVDKESGLTHTEIVKIKTVRSLVPIATVVAEADKRGVKLTDEEAQEIKTSVEQIKQSYGDALSDALKGSGYDSIEQYESLMMFQKLYEKAFNAFHEDPVSYVKNFKNAEEFLSDDKVTVKHVLLTFPEGVTKESDAEAKAETLKKAEEVLKKAKAGEDFDKLLEEYNEDPGQGKNGYTFSNDGTMVQEFADASFKLEVGDISEIVETSYGYHIVKRVERVADFEEYTDLLEKNLTVKVNRKVYVSTPIDVNLKDYIGEVAE